MGSPALAALEQLPPVSDAAKRVGPLLRDVFSGDLAKVFKAVPEFEKGAEDGEGGEAPVEAEITELDRLAYVVHRIDHECAVVPRGAVQLTAAKEVVPAKDFTGA